MNMDTEIWRKAKTILFVASPGTQILDVTGPFQVFIRAAEILARHFPNRPAAYQAQLVSTANKTIRTSSGLMLVSDCNYLNYRGNIDTLLIAGGSGMEQCSGNQKLLSWLRRKSNISRRVGSICTGAFLLAEAGLLDGKRVVTHWKWCEKLSEQYPSLKVDPDPIFIKEGKFYTSAGITAGMDLALAMVEEDFGAQLALDVAREMVIYLRRPGGQTQFSAALSFQMANRKPIQQLHGWVMEHLSEILSVATLAERAAMSPRNFARVFSKETGITPAKYVEQLRMEAGCRELEETDRSLDEIANDCGFGSADSMRRVFIRLRGVSPGQYRIRFKRKTNAENKRITSRSI